MTPIQLEVVGSIRCDLLGYRSPNIQGPKKAIRIFPSGSRGRFMQEELCAMVVRAWPGTHVILKTSAASDWQDHPWRCIRVIEGACVEPASGGKLSGARVPDLDWLDSVDAKKTDPDFQQSYPNVASLDLGVGWSFGRVGGTLLKRNIRVIRIEREPEGAE